ncbi:MAG: serine/threonine protein kinase [Candidatus Eisenbacteria bacterium]|uniref:non-specific serine/threonine protein kinase n=1 Tax=Eiseniibacteriota bacterium TaxID=2212470 RepID=A0A956RMY9_UNCEI|nr:serine/threonine protein kinase [Candidatus Eisenbacteria bacterium]
MGRTLVGKTLGSYKILSLIGQGGMGEVYAAKDTRLDRTVALKVLPPGMAEVPERRARFEREAKAVAALNHPHIVTLHSVEEADGWHFITMELVQGQPLHRLVPDHGLSPERVFELAIPIVDAVAAAHRKGIAHRDLKPDNVMVTDEGRVKVLDFGLAKLLDPTDPAAGGEISGDTGTVGSPVTEEGRVLGTVAYMSPEQAEGKPSDHRSDIFSLGVLLYVLSTGRRPFTGTSNAAVLAAILRDTPKPVHEVNTDLPSGLGRIVRRCLEKDPDRRFQGADDLRLELEDVRREHASAGRSPNPGTGLSSRTATATPAGTTNHDPRSARGSTLRPSDDGSSDSFAGRTRRAGLPRLLVVFALVSVLVSSSFASSCWSSDSLAGSSRERSSSSSSACRSWSQRRGSRPVRMYPGRCRATRSDGRSRGRGRPSPFRTRRRESLPAARHRAVSALGSPGRKRSGADCWHSSAWAFSSVDTSSPAPRESDPRPPSSPRACSRTRVGSSSPTSSTRRTTHSSVRR